jgi:hypothetical protein
MPAILYGSVSPVPPSALPPRKIGTVLLEDPGRLYVDRVVFPSTRNILAAQISDRRREARVKEDTSPLVVEVRGQWIDDINSKFRDFAAALLNRLGRTEEA